jgi:hypothetical protein
MSALTLAECDAVERTFQIGLSRQELPAIGALAAVPEPANPALACLSLVAQRRRYVVPGPVPPERPEPRVPRDDSRPVLDPETGRLLQRMVDAGGTRAAAPLLEAAVARLARKGVQPHPFQMPKILAALKKQGCTFGLNEKVYLAEVSPIPERGDTMHENLGGIDESNWTGFPRAIRVAYIEALRRRDPAPARMLVEACLAVEPANVRADLLGALAVGISADDRSFLEGLAQDRAQTVRDAAARLLALVQGAPAHAEQLAKASAALQLSSEGLIRRKRTLKPANSATTFAQFQKLFEGLTFEALAERLELSPADLATIVSPGSEALLLALANLAARTGCVEALTGLIRNGLSNGRNWTAFASVLEGDLDDGQRAQLVEALAPFGADPFPRARDWRALAALAGAPLPPDLAEPIFGSPGWRELMTALSDEKSPRRMEADIDLAALASVLPISALHHVSEAANHAGLIIGSAISSYAVFAAALEQRSVSNLA